MRILQIEWQSSTAQSVELMLKSEGFNVFTTDLGEEGVDLAKIYDYDLILLELSLPDMPGLDALRAIRLAKVETPVMILSGAAEIDTKVKALGAGADDYMTKPFHKDELVARIHAVIRRSRGHAVSNIEVGPIAINLDAKTVDVCGNRLHLTGKEYLMLELLALRRGVTITKEQFLNHLYGGMDEPEMKIVDVFMCKVRKKIRDAGGGDHIQTVWGRGYVLSEEDGPGPRKIAAVPSKSKAGTVPGLIMQCLLDGPANFSEIATATNRSLNHVATQCRWLQNRGQVVNRGERGRSEIHLTPAGRAWLVANGVQVDDPTPETVAAE